MTRTIDPTDLLQRGLDHIAARTDWPRYAPVTGHLFDLRTSAMEESAALERLAKAAGVTDRPNAFSEIDNAVWDKARAMDLYRAAMDPDFMDWVKQADKALSERYGIDLDDAGIAPWGLHRFKLDGDTPQGWADWRGEKYGLTLVEDWNFNTVPLSLRRQARFT